MGSEHVASPSNETPFKRSASPSSVLGSTKSKPLKPLSRRRRSWVSRDVSNFQQVEQVGEGTYGQVWSATDKRTNELVALKRVRMDNEKEGFPLTAIREIKLLKTLHHENIVNLKEIVTGKGESHQNDSKDNSDGNSNNNSNSQDEESSSSRTNKHKQKNNSNKGGIYMVFEYMDHDLTGLMDTPSIKFSEAQVKCFLLQILYGLEFCHRNEILHRDIKGSNLLIDNYGNLKIADFGLARTFGELGRKYTNRVITLWYRPPELLLGSNEYGPSVDMWSMGCLLAELLTRKPLFPGKDENEQLDLIFHVLGTPNDEIWPGWKDLPGSKLFLSDDHSLHKPNLFKYFEKMAHYHNAPCNSTIMDLLSNMLTLDPKQRFTASQALSHKWFYEEPYACRKEDLPKCVEPTHEFQAKRRRHASMLNKVDYHQDHHHQNDHNHNHHSHQQHHNERDSRTHSNQ